MWVSITQKLKNIQDNLTKHEAYVEYADGVSLSSVELGGVGNRSLSVQFTPTTTLNGLTRLVTDITTILHEAQIEQESALSVIKSEVDKCKYFSENNVAYLRHQQNSMYHTHGIPNNNGIHTGNTSSSGGTGGSEELLATSSWDAEESNPSQSLLQTTTTITTKDDKHMKAEMVQRQLRRSVQELHNTIVHILDTKLAAYDVISSCMETYLHSMVKIAQDHGITNALKRARRLVQPQLNELLGHVFLETAEIHALLRDVQGLWATAFYRSDVALAERNLVVNQKTLYVAEHMGMTRFKMGAGLTLLLWSFSECFNNEKIGQEIWHDPTFAIFMCFGDLLLLLWMWGLSMRVWRMAGIDFVRLLRLEGTEIDGQRAPEATVYSSATDLSLIFLVIFICFNKAVRGVFNIHGSLAVAHALPTLMIVFFIYRMLHPPVPRKKWLQMLWLVCTAPMNPVIFRDGYIGDLLTSLVRVLIPMCFSFAYLIMSAAAWLSNDMKAAASRSNVWWQDSPFYRLLLVPFLTLMPLWIRLMQCLRRSVETGQRWPHMANALKYTSAIAVISYGTFRPHLRGNSWWIASFVGATLFQFSWDLTMDWGIVVRANSKDASEITCLGLSMRRTRLLGPAWIYMMVICTNLAMRFAWALTLLPDDQTEGKSFYSTLLFHLGPLVAAGEVVRRMIWGFFRLEWEQLEVLGSPDFPSLSLSDAIDKSHGTFEKTEFNNDLGNKDVKISLPINNPTASSSSSYMDMYGGEWILTTPYVSVVGLCLLKLSSLENHANPVTKARFVESVLFASMVMMVILSAAAPEIYMLL